MIRHILAVSALALAAPAMAQTTTGGSGPPTVGGESLSKTEVQNTLDDTTPLGVAARATTGEVLTEAEVHYTNWDYSGDWGEIGSPDWGTNRSMVRTNTSATAMGGPIDVDAEWSIYATDASRLSPLEFGVWMLEAGGQDVEQQVEASMRSRASNLPAIQVLNVTADALAQADLNGDWYVSREEMMRFAT